MKGKHPPAGRIELGLAISALSLNYGETRTCRDIAAFCGCQHQNISLIEQRALRRLRIKLLCHKDPIVHELVETLTKR